MISQEMAPVITAFFAVLVERAVPEAAKVALKLGEHVAGHYAYAKISVYLKNHRDANHDILKAVLSSAVEAVGKTFDVLEGRGSTSVMRDLIRQMKQQAVNELAQTQSLPPGSVLHSLMVFLDRPGGVTVPPDEELSDYTRGLCRGLPSDLSDFFRDEFINHFRVSLDERIKSNERVFRATAVAILRDISYQQSVQFNALIDKTELLSGENDLILSELRAKGEKDSAFDGCTQIDDQFLQLHGTAGRATPMEFFTFRPHAQWHGIIKGWDLKRSFAAALTGAVASQMSEGTPYFPAAVIVGSGGEGKSVAVKRLGVDLVRSGHKCFWMESLDRLLANDDMVFASVGKCCILVDDVQLLEWREIQLLAKKVEQHPGIVVILSGRPWPGLRKLRPRLMSRGAYADTDFGDDKKKILDRIAHLVPEWEVLVREVASQSIHKSRLVHMLLILSRGVAAPLRVDDVYDRFLEVIIDDWERVKLEAPGLAEAVLRAADCQSLGGWMSARSFLSLAGTSDSATSVPSANRIAKDHQWEIVRPLMEYNAHTGTVSVVHDEIAAGLVDASKLNMLGGKYIVDEVWRKQTLERLIQCGSGESASAYIYSMSRHKYLTPSEVLRYSMALVGMGITHESYVHALTRTVPVGKEDTIWAAAEQLASLAPAADQLWSRIVTWGTARYGNPQTVRGNWEKLISLGVTSHVVLLEWLRSLPPAERWSKIKELVQERGVALDYRVLLACMPLSGISSKEIARLLLCNNLEIIHPMVVERCLKVLESEAAPIAKWLIRDEAARSQLAIRVLIQCLEILGNETVQIDIALIRDRAMRARIGDDAIAKCFDLLSELSERIGENGGQLRSIIRKLASRVLRERELVNIGPLALARCLSILGEEARVVAREVLMARESNNAEVLLRCLRILGSEAKEYALSIMLDKANRDAVNGHVMARCIQIVGEEARTIAAEILEESDGHPEVQIACIKVGKVDPRVIDYCRKRLSNWEQLDSGLLVVCLATARDSVEAGGAAGDILSRNPDTMFSEVVGSALRVRSAPDWRLEMAISILANWKLINRSIVFSALAVFEEDPGVAEVQRACLRIAKEWRGEVRYQIKHRLPKEQRHIICAFTNPTVVSELRRYALQIVRFCSEQPESISPTLRQLAERIASGGSPQWLNPDLLGRGVFSFDRKHTQ